jgi:hypothetical protein
MKFSEYAIKAFFPICIGLATAMIIEPIWLSGFYATIAIKFLGFTLIYFAAIWAVSWNATKDDVIKLIGIKG